MTWGEPQAVFHFPEDRRTAHLALIKPDVDAVENAFSGMLYGAVSVMTPADPKSRTGIIAITRLRGVLMM